MLDIGMNYYFILGERCDEPGWKYYNEWCWYVSSSNLGQVTGSWYKAQEKCHEMGGDLASIHSSKENAVLSTVVSVSISFMLSLNQNSSSYHFYLSDDVAISHKPEIILDWAEQT